jgi:predicted transcriptional regulator
MERKNSNYFTKIYRKFLEFATDRFKSYNTTCIYIYLKLKYNIYLQLNLNKCFKIDTSEIAKLFHINRATVYDSLKELQDNHLLKKVNVGCYSLISDEAVVESINTINDAETNFKDDQFIMIKNNLFIDLFVGGCTTRDAYILYYIMSRGKYTEDFNPLVRTDETENSISKNLRMDNRTVKNSLQKLIYLELVTKEQNKLYIIPQNCGINKTYRKAKNTEMEEKMPVKSIATTKAGSDYYPELEGLGELLGWRKSKDGRTEAAILKTQCNGIVLGPSRNSNGIPPTEKEFFEQEHLRKYGRPQEIDEFSI